MGKNKGKRSHTKHVFVQKKYRDALFRRIFNEKPAGIWCLFFKNHASGNDLHIACGSFSLQIDFFDT